MDWLFEFSVFFNFELLIVILGIFLVGYAAGFAGAIIALSKRL